MATTAIVTPLNTTQIMTTASRALMLLLALGIFATGFVVLSSPLSIPFTLGLWLSAATLVGWAAFGHWSEQ